MSTIGLRAARPRPLGSGLATELTGLTRSVMAALLPPTCCLCGYPGIQPGLDLCAICAETLPLNGAGQMRYPPVFSRALVPYLYAYPVDRFVRALKFRGERMYARVLGTMLAQAHQQSGAALPQVLVPVPLHPSRYRERGFNQSVEIARYAGAQLGMRVETGCLTRVVATEAQSGLPFAERRRNVSGAFRLMHPPGAGHVALVDDVLTTGSTAAEAAHTLTVAGPCEIELWCAAWVDNVGAEPLDARAARGHIAALAPHGIHE